jgi:hypothetical protein
MVDGPPGGLSTSERLELLRLYEASWKNLEWSEKNTLASTLDNPSPHTPSWEFYGNVCAHSIGRDAIDFVQLPSRLRGIPMRQWTIRFDFEMSEFSMDLSQDLLVIIENASRKYV